MPNVITAAHLINFPAGDGMTYLAMAVRLDECTAAVLSPDTGGTVSFAPEAHHISPRDVVGLTVPEAAALIRVTAAYLRSGRSSCR